jgi:hypothetical protein
MAQWGMQSNKLTHEVINDRDFVNQRFAEHGGVISSCAVSNLNSGLNNLQSPQHPSCGSAQGVSLGMVKRNPTITQ